MPTYISHINWTEQGIRSVKDSPKRLDAVKKQLRELGGELKAFYMTQGTYDALLIYEIPSDTALAKLMLQIGAAGNVRTTTVRAYTEVEYREIMAGLR
ncbi:MAG: GYD domain-containing protein [Chloroflexi bacterium]|nr:MAG: GYD domain-containing protein [Chloroflexota bacterium]